ncbi:hypothetical protein DFP94_101377 [Fontibacillus phaseoli]|uniref:Uncharacterized protein n=1 Tax=Fontibacillus phaseoli TaxID=1416533 RepID=A0A369BMG4_9BACL|nr:hypothetical protein [Fontibacillus phaseoli]RCX22792.1 hypothetical protein DFP94_101377 [Fontibacillus phaseoli]
MTDRTKEKRNHPVSSKKRVDYPRKTHQEEYAAEVVPMNTVNRDVRRERRKSDDTRIERSDSGTATAGRTVGYIGVGFGIAALFMWSIILGPLAAVMGFYAYSQGNKTSGAWAIGLGVVATLSYFVLIPFTR